MLMALWTPFPSAARRLRRRLSGPTCCCFCLTNSPNVQNDCGFVLTSALCPPASPAEPLDCLMFQPHASWKLLCEKNSCRLTAYSLAGTASGNGGWEEYCFSAKLDSQFGSYCQLNDANFKLDSSQKSKLNHIEFQLECIAQKVSA